MRSISQSWLEHPVRRFVASALPIAIVAVVAATPAHADTYPDLKYPSPPILGQWDHNQAGMFAPLAADMVTSKTYYGMRHTETWFDSILHTVTGDQLYLNSNVVQMASGGALTGAPWLGVALKSSPAGLVPDARIKNWTGAAVESTAPDGNEKYTVANSITTEDVAYGGNTFSWSSANGDIQLTGKLVAPGFNFLLPWREPGGATDKMYYQNQDYEVSGTYYGEAVSGYVKVENMWGNQNYRDTWWVKNRIGSWVFFSTKYDDGTTESGNFMCGEYGANAAVVTKSDGTQVLNASELNVTQQPNNDIRYELGNGRNWELIYDPTSKLGTLGGIGLIRRVGEKRKVVNHEALYIKYGIPAATPINCQGLKQLPVEKEKETVQVPVDVPGPTTTVTTQAPPPPVVPVTATLPSAGTVADGFAVLKLTNTGKAAISGEITLKGKVKGRTVTVGSADVVIGAGKTKTVKAFLSAGARKALKGKSSYAVSTTYALENASGGTLKKTTPVKLKVPTKRR